MHVKFIFVPYSDQSVLLSTHPSVVHQLFGTNILSPSLSLVHILHSQSAFVYRICGDLCTKFFVKGQGASSPMFKIIIQTIIMFIILFFPRLNLANTSPKRVHLNKGCAFILNQVVRSKIKVMANFYWNPVLDHMICLILLTQNLPLELLPVNVVLWPWTKFLDHGQEHSRSMKNHMCSIHV